MTLYYKFSGIPSDSRMKGGSPARGGGERGRETWSEGRRNRDARRRSFWCSVGTPCLCRRVRDGTATARGRSPDLPRPTSTGEPRLSEEISTSRGPRHVKSGATWPTPTTRASRRPSYSAWLPETGGTTTPDPWGGRGPVEPAAGTATILQILQAQTFSSLPSVYHREDSPEVRCFRMYSGQSSRGLELSDRRVPVHHKTNTLYDHKTDTFL